MTDVGQKKGMSKGCMIALIVGGVILVLVIVAMVTCYAKKDDLMKFGATTIINEAKMELVKNPVEGVDTVQFNAVADAYVEKLNAEELDYEKFSAFFVDIQAMFEDKVIDLGETEDLVEAMINYYPDLESLRNPTEEVETTEEDTTAVETM